MSNDLPSRMRRAQARYELARGLSLGLFVAVVLASLVLLVVQSREITRQGNAQARADMVQQGLSEQIVRQGDQLETLLDAREFDRASRALEVAEAVQVLTRAQQNQLDQHDIDVSSRLQLLLTEIGKLQDPPREVTLPPVKVAPKAVAPARKPAAAPRQTAPAPRTKSAPAPSTCLPKGKSGRCR